jgi:uncharacterized ion transporter superfamily protein YfcC
MNKIFIILFLLIYNLFLFITPSFSEDNKIKIGLLVPLTGENSEYWKTDCSSHTVGFKRH